MVSIALAILDALVFIAVVVPFILLVRHRGAIPALPAVKAPGALPSLSVIVPARNEATAIGRALASVLAQDYPGLEIVAVDDRSTDGTGDVLRELAAANPSLRVLRIDDLPSGWLGKNHALWRGAQRSRGTWLLFTDADVVFAPGALRRALAYALAERLDHLTLAPRLVSRSFMLGAFVAFFAYAFVALWGAYLANDPNSKRGVGVGAFNLVRREAYEAIGTMAALSLRPDDDIRLGRRLRAFGFRQRVLNGREWLSVSWYPSLAAAVRGLEKSMFSSLEYRLVDAGAVVLFIISTMVWPFVGVIVLDGIDRALLAMVVVCQLAGFLETYRQSMGRIDARAVAQAALLPITALLFAYAIVRATYLALVTGRVTWRDTAYPLAELRAQTGLEGVPRS